MSWALDNLGPDRCRDIAASLFRVREEQCNGNWLRGHCPLPGHEDKNPSFGYDFINDKFKCLTPACNGYDGGDLIDLWSAINGHDKRAGFKAFKARFGQESYKTNGRRDNRPAGAGSGNSEGGGNGKTEKPKRPARADEFIAEETWAALPKLPEAWLQKLEKQRGWSREVIQAQGLRLWRHAVSGEERVAIPVRDGQGRLRNIRKYLPGASEGQKIKSWWEERAGEIVVFGEARLFPPVESWGPEPLWLCEGEPDCLCALSQGLNAATVTGGAGNWRPAWTETMAGRHVIIAYDADSAGHKGARKVAQRITGTAAEVKIIAWPEFMLKEGELPKKGGQDLTNWFITHGRGREELERLAYEAQVMVPPEVAIPDQDLADLQTAADNMIRFKAWSAFDEKTAYRSMLFVRDVLATHRILFEAQTKILYIWEGRYWMQAAPEEIKRLMALKMGMAATRARIEEAWELLKAQVTLVHGEEMNLRPELICMQNGMLDLNSGFLMPHEPAYHCTHMFPYRWLPHDPPKCPWFKRTLYEILANPEVIEEVLEFIGYCLWHSQVYKKALLMVGRKDCGKSLLQEIIRQLLGPENCSAVNLADLEDQFQRVALHSKMANICGETSANFFASDNFKRLTGGDPLQAAYKGVDTFTFNTQAKLIFAANEFPKVNDQTDAFYERMLAVNFSRQFKLGERWADPHRLQRIVPHELPGIFHLALVKLYQLRKRGAFSQCRTSFQFLNQYRLENDHVSCFVDERCILQDSDGGLPEGPKAVVYSSYKKWCEENGIRRVKDSARFWQAIKQQLPQLEFKNHGPSMGDGVRPPWVYGLHLRERESAAA